ncbi:hypothetical protein A4H97_27545 [Niastella yeongjuensis]|uniref:Uncharacterized protein n=1 Tax=Niastella yeongjuensis TaxID=354355 RepID=A0A1V9EZC7_9BACT|nr:hypothetical protein [Niastella yeongjuensis]OQP51335.1 hypothetical protein A4H97_27545 [Niastella yeongjuensis]SEP38736.1 hypothetical protein SAMN05660816_05645 [Niastella yeongjuensis]
MKKFFISVAAGILFGSFWLSSCNKKDDLTSDAVTDYLNLEKGKYILYRYDSLRFVDFDQFDTMVTYQAKEVVEDATTDNQGRNGWRIVRYIRDWTDTAEDNWQPILTYAITPSDRNIEMSENSLRAIKLVGPITNGYSWHGNGFYPERPYEVNYDFDNDQNIQTWDYTYHDVGTTLNLNGKDYENTISVTQVADSANVPISQTITGYKNLWTESYAKGIGLVYKEVAVWQWQGATGTQSGYYTGFGITMSILDHN